MDKLLYFMKIWAIIQLIVIIVLLLFYHIANMLLNYKNQKREKKKTEIRDILTKLINNQAELSSANIDLFKQNIIEFITVMKEFDSKNAFNNNWQTTKQILSDKVLKTEVYHLSESNNWFKRYLATQCSQLGANLYDEEILIKLVQDETLIVAINATILILNHPTQHAVNEMLTVFGKSRHLLQTTIADIVRDSPIENELMLRNFILTRLHYETDPYIRIFCYRILNHLPFPQMEEIAAFKKDLESTHIDLIIGAMTYFANVDSNYIKPFLLETLEQENFALRTNAVKLLGKSKDESVIPYLSKKLSDKEWWVRINSANELMKFGKKGEEVLKSQSPEKDRFAYETAQVFLKGKSTDERR